MLIVTVHAEGGPEAWKIALPRAVKAGIIRALRWWHREILPRHFAHYAPMKYGYQRRGWEYNTRKKRFFGHTRPLEFTGALKRATMQRPKIQVLAGRAAGRMTMRGTQALNFSGRSRGKWASYPDMRKEITTTVGKEIRDIGAIIHQTGVRFMNEYEQRSSRRLAG